MSSPASPVRDAPLTVRPPGVVRAPVFTTAVQVASRFLLVWGIVHPFPQTAASPLYASMLLAWSTTEVVRYSYFALALVGAEHPAFTRLRYSTFLVLYPLGIASECGMILSAIGPAADVHPLLPAALYAVLALYVPGSYVMYTHMLRQRRKVLARLAASPQAGPEASSPGTAEKPRAVPTPAPAAVRPADEAAVDVQPRPAAKKGR